MARDEARPQEATRSVTITRDFNAPRELVWKAWTEPERFAQWFGTPPFTTPLSTIAMDLRPGGEWRASQVSADGGTVLPFVGVYREIVEPERLVFTFENPDDRSDPNVEVLTVTLRDIAGKTEMVVRQEGHMPAEQYELLKAGYSGFFDQLEKYLAKG